MTSIQAIAATKISDVLRPKGANEVARNFHVVQARKVPQPDYEAMRRITSGEGSKSEEGKQTEEGEAIG